MWVFYLISLPLTTGMVALTLQYFASPDVPCYVRFTVGYAWFCSLSIIILVPADIWTAIIGHDKSGISFFWSWSYWSTFLLTWAVVPIIQGYEDAGDFSVAERLKTSAQVNLVYYLCVGSIALFGVILLIILHKNWGGSIRGFAMACSNTFGLVTGAFLLGFGLSEIPRGIWRNADWTIRQKVLSHKVAKMAVKLDDAHRDFSNAIVVAQATSKQMSRRDPLRPYMNVIDKMLSQMLTEDPSFKPQGGRLGENDMDYDTDEKTMAALRRHLKKARDQYYRYKSEYLNHVTEALELEDIIKNYEHYGATGWKYISSFRPERTGKLGSVLDVIELIWHCLLRKQLQKVLAVMLGSISAAILLAEATIIPNGVDLSLFSILINAMEKHEMMVARYAPPISYNFLNLIHLDNGAKTIFEKRMGNIDDAVPFFGKGFNKIYPLIMVIYTTLIASNFFDRVFHYFGNWKIFKFFREEADDLDGFDPSGIIILQQERSWIEQGHKVGELVIPLARSFSHRIVDLESGISHRVSRETKTSSSLWDEAKSSYKEPMKAETLHGSTREVLSRKYTTLREQVEEEGNGSPEEKNIIDEASSSHDAEDSHDTRVEPSSKLASTWVSVKMGFRNFKSTMEAKKFTSLRHIQDTKPSGEDSSESLDEIFERIKRPISNHRNYGSDDDDDLIDQAMGIRNVWANR